MQPITHVAINSQTHFTAHTVRAEVRARRADQRRRGEVVVVVVVDRGEMATRSPCWRCLLRHFIIRRCDVAILIWIHALRALADASEHDCAGWRTAREHVGRICGVIGHLVATRRSVVRWLNATMVYETHRNNES